MKAFIFDLVNLCDPNIPNKEQIVVIAEREEDATLYLESTSKLFKPLKPKLHKACPVAAIIQSENITEAALVEQH